MHFHASSTFKDLQVLSHDYAISFLQRTLWLACVAIATRDFGTTRSGETQSINDQTCVTPGSNVCSRNGNGHAMKWN
jgi:hypothetical protein